MNPTITKDGQAAKNRIAEFRQNVNNGATSTEARRTVRNLESGTGRVETPVAMGADTLNSNESLIEVPNIPPTGESDALGSYLESFQQNQTDEFTRAQENRTKQAEGKTSTAFEDYIKGLAGEQSVEGLTMKAEQEFGTPELEQEVNRLNADLMSEQRALKKRLDVLNANAQGGLASGVAGEIANAQRESYSKQADIAVVQLAAQGRFDSAKAMADRKAAIQFADQTRDLGIREKIYTENKEIFTKEEQRLFETKQADRNRRLDAEKEAFTKLQDVKLDALKMAQMNGAPVSVIEAIQKATSPVGVLEAGGQYGSVDLLDRAYKQQQISSSRTSQLLALAEAGDANAIKNLGFDPRSTVVEVDPVVKRQVEEQIIGNEQLIDLATQYRTLVDTYGFTNETFGNAKVLGQVISLRAQMTAAYKKAETLGTLDQGVLTLMNQILGEKPTSSIVGWGEEGNITANITGKRSDRIVSAMDELIATTQASNAKAKLRLGINPTIDTSLDTESDAEINQAYGVTTANSTSSGAFEPSNYFNK